MSLKSEFPDVKQTIGRFFLRVTAASAVGPDLTKTPTGLKHKTSHYFRTNSEAHTATLRLDVSPLRWDEVTPVVRLLEVNESSEHENNQSHVLSAAEGLNASECS